MDNRRSSNMTGLSKKNVVKWSKIFKRICVHAYSKEEKGLIGGENLTVEVDKTHLFKQKNNVGRTLKLQPVWLVCGICRKN